ncbi:hypothetical protein D5018_19615 [Parashewanella curva]|uniref:Uncharacterized protein n=1 Tax=Parashewanella curva TaxID=2338552 RepID=A0A3L8PRG2_9GAMM|nr:hypothetical protein D5018_19615 [Parashewanella curva]
MTSTFGSVRPLTVFIVIFITSKTVSFFKGHESDESLAFALLWSFVAMFTFMAAKLYHTKKGRNCKSCNDNAE